MLTMLVRADKCHTVLLTVVTVTTVTKLSNKIKFVQIRNNYCFSLWKHLIFLTQSKSSLFRMLGNRSTPDCGVLPSFEFLYRQMIYNAVKFKYS